MSLATLESVVHAATYKQAGFRVSGDCLAGAGINGGDIAAVDFTRYPRPPRGKEYDYCLCYGRMPGMDEDIIMVKQYSGVMGGMQLVSTRYKQEPGHFRMNCGFEPKAILGVVYAVYDSEHKLKWETVPAIYPESLGTEPTISGEGIGDPKKIRRSK